MDLSGKRILVTGGAGFLGSHVVRLLNERYGSSVDVCVPRKREFDLVRQDQTSDLFSYAKPDVVIHCAARMGGIGANRANPGAFFYENLMIGSNVMEQVRLSGVQKAVLIGTVCSYPKLAKIPFREDEIWDGYPEETNGPYGLAKKMLLVQADAYRREYGTNAFVLLMVNMYGPGDNFDLETSHVIPALIRKIHSAIASGENVISMWGDGTPTREFLYVEDAASAVVSATERYDGPETVNIGSGNEISIKDLAILVAQYMGYDGVFEWDTSRPNGQPRRILDVTRASARFGFTAQTSLVEGIRNTVQWWTTSNT